MKYAALYEQAVLWYRKAAEQHLAVAQANLGAMCAAGRGVPKDRGQAMGWLHKAATQGNEPAQQILRKLGPGQARQAALRPGQQR